MKAIRLQAAVNIYQTKNLASNPAPIASIAVSHGCPYGLAADKKGTLYVADNCGGNDVEEYAKGQTTLKTAITNGVSNPLGLAIDKSGTLYVSQLSGVNHRIPQRRYVSVEDDYRRRPYRSVRPRAR